MLSLSLFSTISHIPPPLSAMLITGCLNWQTLTFKSLVRTTKLTVRIWRYFFDGPSLSATGAVGDATMKVLKHDRENARDDKQRRKAERRRLKRLRYGDRRKRGELK
jgi:hypothetical protein